MNLVEIGYFSKTHGIKGALQLVVKVDFAIEDCDSLFANMGGSQVPLFIKEFRENKSGFVIQLDDVDAIEKASQYVGKSVSVNADLILEDESQEWLGYHLIDKKFGPVGEISAIAETGNGLIVTVFHKEKEILLPLNEEFIFEVNSKKKEIMYQAPEGLIEMYLH